MNKQALLLKICIHHSSSQVHPNPLQDPNIKRSMNLKSLKQFLYRNMDLNFEDIDLKKKIH